ncbi:hypothetical protein [Streptomyces showdoensis]|uniref:hypothetical protein n=1 Tax=Streptomyces showdoensis TaxID=68268 RepID=UPI0031E5C226
MRGAGAEEGGGRGLDGSGDLAGAQGGDQGGGGDPQAAFAGLGPAVVGHHAPEPAEDQQEHDRGEDRDDADVPFGVPAQRLEEQQDRGDEGGGGEQEQAPFGDPGRRCGRGLGEAGHGGVQGGEAPGGEEDHPADVPGGADLPGALHLLHPVDDVGEEDAAGAEGEQLYGAGAQSAGDQEAGEHRQHQDVAEGVGDGDRPLDPGHVRGGGERGDQVDPGEQGEPGGEDERVERHREVPPGGPVPDEAVQADREERVGGEVEGVGDGREGPVLVEEGLQHVVRGVAGDEGEVGGGEHEPGPAVGRPVQPDAGEDGGDAAESDERPEHGVP